MLLLFIVEGEVWRCDHVKALDFEEVCKCGAQDDGKRGSGCHHGDFR